MRYQLKPQFPAFQVTREGEFEYHHFKHGEIYQKIPDPERDRFEEVASGSDEPLARGGVEIVLKKKPIKGGEGE